MSLGKRIEQRLAEKGWERKELIVDRAWPGIRHHGVDHLVKPRILDVLGIPSLELADIHQMEGVLSMLQTLTLYEGRPSSRLSVSPPLSTLPDPLAAKR